MMKRLFHKQNKIRFKRFANKSYSIFNSMHKVVTIGVLSIATLTFANANDASGQTTQTTQTNNIIKKELDEVVVNASAIEQPINQIAKLITVISKEDIQQLSPQSIEDLLNYVASVDIQTRGSHGVQADVSIRGGSFDQNAILLNGINISNPQTGHYSFDIPINISDIEKIEIIHGPSAIIYGSSAFSGGINIITKKDINKGFYAKLEAGGHNLFNSEFSGKYKIKNVENYLSMGYKTSDGYIKNSDYKIFNTLWQSRLNIKENKIDIQLGYNRKSYGANTFYSAKYPDQYDNTSSILGSIKGEFGKKIKFLPSIYWNRHNDKFELIKNNGNANYHQSNVYGSNINMQYTSKLGVTNYDIEIRNEGILSNVLGNTLSSPIGNFTKEYNRTNISYMIQQNIELKKITISAGILSFYNTSISYKFKLYPSLNINYQILEGLNIYSSYSKSSRLPTFTDLYYTTSTHIGNISLKQEESQSVELGLRFKNRYIISYVSTYLMNCRNMIDWVKQNPEDKWESKNITQINKIGIEVGGKIFINELLDFLHYRTILQINYAKMHQDIIKNDYISNYILNYLKDKLTIQLTLPVYKNNLSSTISFRYQKRMGQYLKYEDLKPTQKVDYPAFSIVDLNLNYKYSKFDFYININNIFDINYYDLGNIPQSGFWTILGLSVNL